MKAPAEDRGASRQPTPAPPPRAVADADAEPTTAVPEPAVRPLSRTAVQRLQSGAGNRAVAALVAQRRAAGSRAPAAPRTRGGKQASAGAAARGAAAGVPAQRSAAPSSSSAGATVVSAGPSPVGPTSISPVEMPVQRLASAADAPPVHRPGPQADPKFAALKTDVRAKQQLMSAHPPAKSEAAKAQGAAKPPQDDKEAQGKAANAEKMNTAKPGEFDKAAFIRAVNEAIAAQAPKNLDEADKFGDSGKADAVKGQVQGQVTDGKKASAKAIVTTTKAPPDTSKAVDKPVTPLVPDKPPGTPGAPDPTKAVPDKAPPAATDFSDGPKQVDQEMAEAQVTEEQLAKSNEPEFTGALKEKNAAEQHAATAPGQVRAAEAQTLAGAKAAAGTAGAAAMTALAADRKQAGAQVGAGKEQAKSADEAKRAKVTAILQKVFDATKKDVEDILSGLDKKVDDQFSKGEKAARDAFTAEHKRRMDEYKDKRYSGILGKGRWIKDKFAGLPEEANQIFVVARKGYVDRMQQVISGVADVIGAELTRAKQRIATGRNELQAEVRKLPADLQALGREAAGEFAGKFDELTEQVNSKGTELVQTLASKYNEALKSVDEEIAAEKEKNKGLVAKAVDAVAGVIKTILQLKDMLMGVLAKATQAVMAIIKDPIGFLGNLVSAVGAGLRAFLANIGEHLKKGLVGWLTGAMVGAGLELPAKFDLRGIVMMIGSLLGLTWAAIRGRIIQKGMPEQAMGAVESSVPLVQKVQAQGLGGLWEEIKEKVGDLKANLFSKISEYLIPTVLMAGITWIISLLNPASAFVRAVKMIIDFVTFIMTQGAQIIEFVNSVLDAIIAIAGGGAGGVPALVEKALARSVPVLIGVLAAVLGIGGIAEKVKKLFKALSKPVMKAVDWVVRKIVGLGKKLWAGIKKRRSKSKEGQKDSNRDQGQTHHPGEERRRPTVRVPFQMAGEPHTLTFEPKARDVSVTMASGAELPLTKKFQQAHTSIDNFKYYMSFIEEDTVKQLYEMELAPKIDAFHAPAVDRFKAVYEEFFPKGASATPLGRTGQQQAAGKVRPLVTEAEKLLEAIKKWGNDLGIEDLSADKIEETIRVKGNEIWRRAHAEKKAEIDTILARHSYEGRPIEYRGSAKTGWRGEHKGKVHFNPSDFDVDMYVVHPEKFEAITRLQPSRETNGKIFPALDRETRELLSLSRSISNELARAFPGNNHIKESTIVLRRNPPR